MILILNRIVLYENGKAIPHESPYLLSDKQFDIDLSIVVPSYNEDQRLPTMMKDTLKVRKRFDI